MRIAHCFVKYIIGLVSRVTTTANYDDAANRAYAAQYAASGP